MTNLQLSNKKTQYSANSEGTNVRIEGQVSVNDLLKVTEYNGTVYAAGLTNAYMGSFNYNQNNASVNIQQGKEFIAEASQLVIDTVKGIEKELITL